VGRWRRGLVGETTLQANACEAEQRPRVRCQWLNRVRSAITQMVIGFEAENASIHKNLLMKSSGQLRNLGLMNQVDCLLVSNGDILKILVSGKCMFPIGEKVISVMQQIP
jgi:hypothetical protein